MRNPEWKLILVAAAAAIAASAQQAGAGNVEAVFTHEGPFWVRTITREAPAHTHLIVSARARIVLRGGADANIVYKLVQRVRSRTEAEARRRFGDASGLLDTPGDVTRLTIMPAAVPGISAEVELYVPHRTLLARLESQGGDVEAYDFDGSVEAGTMFGQIRCDRIGGNVTGRTGGGEIHLGRIGGAVHCTSGGGPVYMESVHAETNCATAGGDMQVREAGGPLLLSTEGNIRVGKAASTVEAHSAAGIIEVGSAGGTVTADTRGGSIQVGSARGVRAESAQGGVRIKTAWGPMSVSAVSGSIFAELLGGGRLDNSTLASGLGDITLLIPSNLAVTIVARNDSMIPVPVVSEFPEIRVQAGWMQSPVTAQGMLNGGGPVLFLNAAAGTIYLRKAK